MLRTARCDDYLACATLNVLLTMISPSTSNRRKRYLRSNGYTGVAFTRHNVAVCHRYGSSARHIYAHCPTRTPWKMHQGHIELNAPYQRWVHFYSSTTSADSPAVTLCGNLTDRAHSSTRSSVRRPLPLRYRAYRPSRGLTCPACGVRRTARP